MPSGLQASAARLSQSQRHQRTTAVDPQISSNLRYAQIVRGQAAARTRSSSRSSAAKLARSRTSLSTENGPRRCPHVAACTGDVASVRPPTITRAARCGRRHRPTEFRVEPDIWNSLRLLNSIAQHGSPENRERNLLLTIIDNGDGLSQRPEQIRTADPLIRRSPYVRRYGATKRPIREQTRPPPTDRVFTGA
jgi:hypothetical protein